MPHEFLKRGAGVAQDSLFHEDFRSSLRHTINAIGGPKAVAHALRPAMKMDQARAWLNNCLDASRPEKLDLDDIEFVLAEGRKAGCHAAMYYLCQFAGYEEPRPTDPISEDEKLRREFVESVKTLREIEERMMRNAHLRSAS